MLKYRILTAIILIPIFITLLFTLSPIGFCLFTGAIVLWCAWEWSALMGVKKLPYSLLYPLIMLFVLYSALLMPNSYALNAAAAWWLCALVLVITYSKSNRVWGKSIFLRAMMGFLVLIPCWLALNLIRNAQNGVFILLFLFILIWGADSGAYFVGKKWGKTKLAPRVSPGKSWQGLVGALMTTVVIALCALYFLKTPTPIWLPAIILSLVTVLASVLGDLFESMMKRNVDLKDSGRLLPGHGGMLDRIDSLTAAAPVFALGAMLIGRFFH